MHMHVYHNKAVLLIHTYMYMYVGVLYIQWVLSYLNLDYR